MGRNPPPLPVARRPKGHAPTSRANSPARPFFVLEEDKTVVPEGLLDYINMAISADTRRLETLDQRVVRISTSGEVQPRFYPRHVWEYPDLPWWKALFNFTRRCKACGAIEGASEGLACSGEMQSNLPIPFGSHETE